MINYDKKVLEEANQMARAVLTSPDVLPHHILAANQVRVMVVLVGILDKIAVAQETIAGLMAEANK